MSKLLKLYPISILGYAVFPIIASAQTKTISIILRDVGFTLQTIISILFVIATLVFLWGVIQFIAGAGDETRRNKAKAIMTWGIVGLAVMAAAWGIVLVLTNYFGVGGVGIPPGPSQGQPLPSQWPTQ